jgi:uncharacterized protein (TIGR03086 family)
MDDPRPLFRDALRTATEVVEGVRPDQLHLPTPCEGMDVEAMLRHVVSVVDRIALIGRGGDPFSVTPRTTLEGAWAEALADYESVWADDAALGVTSPLPWAPGDGRDVLRMYVFELTTHTWDLATATGQSPSWDDAVLAAAAEWTATNMGTTPAERAALFEPVYDALPPSFRDMPPPFGDPLPVADDASPLDKVVAWSGRVASAG